MLEQTIWPPNHTSHTKVYFNEFVANALRDNMGMVYSIVKDSSADLGVNSKIVQIRPTVKAVQLRVTVHFL